MKSINFNQGVIKEYAINGDESNTIRVNISDLNLEKRINEIDTSYHEILRDLGDAPTVQQLVEADAKLRTLVDHVFHADICSHAFGDTNLFSPDGNGGAAFLSFCEAFAVLLKEDITELTESKKPYTPRPEVQKYLPADPPVTHTGTKPIAGLSQPYGAPLPDVSCLTYEQKRELLSQLI